MKKQAFFLLVLAGWLAIGLQGKIAAGVASAAAGPRIQLAILLDTSGSMDGLIDQARSRLWKIVNELATARKNGQAPRLQVALYEYGQDGIPAAAGYLRRIVPLSDDLDRISEELFKLKTNGGEEYCGQVIQSAVRELEWSGDSGDLKMIVIAGNEPFTPGRDRLPRLVPRSHRPRHHRQHHFLRQLPGRAADGLEGRGRPGRRPVPGHRRRPDPAADQRPAGRRDRPPQPGTEPDLYRLRQGRRPAARRGRRSRT